MISQTFPGTIHLLLLPLLISFPLPSSPATTPIPTNMDLIVATIEEATDRALTNLDDRDMLADGGGTVLVVSQSKHDANWLVEHVLIDRLLQRGLEVLSDSSSAVAGNARLAFRVLELGIRATSGLRGSTATRESHATLALQLSARGEDTVTWQDETTVFRKDSVPKDQLDLLQDSSYDFAKTELEEETWSKFAEPVIVSTVLGGLIYLFFSNR